MPERHLRIAKDLVRKFSASRRGQTEIPKSTFKGRQSAKDNLVLSPQADTKGDRLDRAEKPRKHPLVLSGGRHPPERREAPKFSTPTPTKDTSTRPTEARTQGKAPASGTMSHTPENATQRGSGVTSGSDRASTNFIGGVEAVQRAGDEAARRRLEQQLWGIGIGGGN